MLLVLSLLLFGSNAHMVFFSLLGDYKNVESTSLRISAIQDLSHSFSPYGPPSRQITYIYVQRKLQSNQYVSLDLLVGAFS